MDFFGKVIADPLFYVGYILSVFAAISFLIFLKGFLQGLQQVVFIDGNEEHLDHEHSREHITLGVLLMIFIFILWELLRWFVATF